MQEQSQLTWELAYNGNNPNGLTYQLENGKILSIQPSSRTGYRFMLFDPRITVTVPADRWKDVVESGTATSDRTRSIELSEIPGHEQLLKEGSSDELKDEILQHLGIPIWHKQGSCLFHESDTDTYMIKVNRDQLQFRTAKDSVWTVLNNREALTDLPEKDQLISLLPDINWDADDWQPLPSRQQGDDPVATASPSTSAQSQPNLRQQPAAAAAGSPYAQQQWQHQPPAAATSSSSSVSVATPVADTPPFVEPDTQGQQAVSPGADPYAAMQGLDLMQPAAQPLWQEEPEAAEEEEDEVSEADQQVTNQWMLHDDEDGQCLFYIESEEGKPSVTYYISIINNGLHCETNPNFSSIPLETIEMFEKVVPAYQELQVRRGGERTLLKQIGWNVRQWRAFNTEPTGPEQNDADAEPIQVIPIKQEQALQPQQQWQQQQPGSPGILLVQQQQQQQPQQHQLGSSDKPNCWRMNNERGCLERVSRVNGEDEVLACYVTIQYGILVHYNSRGLYDGPDQKLKYRSLDALNSALGSQYTPITEVLFEELKAANANKEAARKVLKGVLTVINRGLGVLVSMLFTSLYYPLLATADSVARGWERMAGRVASGEQQGREWQPTASALGKALYRISGLVIILAAPITYAFSLLGTVLYRAPKRGLTGGLRSTFLRKEHAWDTLTGDKSSVYTRSGDVTVFHLGHVAIALLVVLAWSALIAGLALGPLAAVPVFSAINSVIGAVMGKLGVNLAVGLVGTLEVTALAAALTTAATAVAAGAIWVFQQLGNLLGYAADKGAKAITDSTNGTLLPYDLEDEALMHEEDEEYLAEQVQAEHTGSTLRDAMDASEVFDTLFTRVPAAVTSCVTSESDYSALWSNNGLTD